MRAQHESFFEMAQMNPPAAKDWVSEYASADLCRIMQHLCLSRLRRNPPLHVLVRRILSCRAEGAGLAVHGCFSGCTSAAVGARGAGNLEDITLRAVRVLRCADRVLAEDTRHTRKLLNHLGIRTPLTSFHEHNERGKQAQVCARCRIIVTLRSWRAKAAPLAQPLRVSPFPCAFTLKPKPESPNLLGTPWCFHSIRLRSIAVPFMPPAQDVGSEYCVDRVRPMQSGREVPLRASVA